MNFYFNEDKKKLYFMRFKPNQIFKNMEIWAVDLRI